MDHINVKMSMRLSQGRDELKSWRFIIFDFSQQGDWNEHKSLPRARIVLRNIWYAQPKSQKEYCMNTKENLFKKWQEQFH